MPIINCRIQSMVCGGNDGLWILSWMIGLFQEVRNDGQRVCAQVTVTRAACPPSPRASAWGLVNLPEIWFPLVHCADSDLELTAEKRHLQGIIYTKCLSNCVLDWTISSQQDAMVPIPRTSECDFIWNPNLDRGNWVRMLSLGWVLIRYLQCLYKMGKFGYGVRHS